LMLAKTHNYARFIITQISIQLVLDTRYRFVLALFFKFKH
jgi:hypothetical protein